MEPSQDLSCSSHIPVIQVGGLNIYLKSYLESPQNKFLYIASFFSLEIYMGRIKAFY